MKTLRFTTVLLAGLGCWWTAPTEVQSAPAGYQLAWEENFEGTQLDTTKWKVETYFRRVAQNSVEAIGVKEGVMSITTYTEGGKHHTGFITTKGKYEPTFGYIEARIRFRSTPGEWGAFWMQTPTMGNPLGDVGKAGTEIDIVEHRAAGMKGEDLRNMYVMNLHWDGYAKGTHKTVGAKSKVPADSPALQDNWHNYAVLWTPEKYVFYLDGIEQWSTTNAVSHRSEYILLTCEVQDKGWAGTIPPTGFGSRGESKTKMDVDWVRVWQSKDPAESKKASPGA